MAINIDDVEKEHVVEAAGRWRVEPGYGGFGESTRYDILIEGRPYPPKAIACECAGAPRPRPSEFRGAWNGRWHKALKALGFPIVPKVRFRLGTPLWEGRNAVDPNCHSVGVA
ncbi:hypothetical protein EVC45_43925 [Paraburkholderia sp. UYCP14C]|uniref:hypothetical protein n=1 Tax=Paraburkholderia sp. UYCP14C TaxID=2511130 RepID=UPI00101F323F|nr:hypothetical protein [Paraburkholderia sp. UYCP14C]RZF23539.1 hypothetical protein EVC45_43925 [Paraburkholderia sp. UYCP14C]